MKKKRNSYILENKTKEYFLECGENGWTNLVFEIKKKITPQEDENLVYFRNKLKEINEDLAKENFIKIFKRSLTQVFPKAIESEKMAYYLNQIFFFL